MVDKNGNVIGKDWVTKLRQNYVGEDDAAKAINAINSLYNIDLTASTAASSAASIVRLLDALLINDLSTRMLFAAAKISYNNSSRKKYVNSLVDLGLIGWDESLSKRSPNQALHLTDLGKAVLQRIKKK